MAISRDMYRARVRASLASQGAAYGFTITVWASGALASAVYGPLTVLRVLLYALGPLVMYALLIILLYRPREVPEQLIKLHPSAFGFLDFLSVPAGVGTALLVYKAVPWPLIGIPVGSFLAALVYNLLLSAQLLVFMSRSGSE